MDQVFFLQQIIAYSIIIFSSIFLYFGIKKNFSVSTIYLGYLSFWMAKYYLESLAIKAVEFNATDKAFLYSVLWASFVAIGYFINIRFFCKKR